MFIFQHDQNSLTPEILLQIQSYEDEIINVSDVSINTPNDVRDDAINLHCFNECHINSCMVDET